MIALVTGASSGIGRDISIELAERGYDIIAVARNFQRLNDLKKEIEQNFTERKVHIKTCDMSSKEQCKNLYNDVKKTFGNIDILVNNAGFGLCSEFTEADLDKEISMIETNITGLHILMKLFLKDMVEKNSGYIMNVASIAGFMPGPLMATYYATKAYVFRLTQSIQEELNKMGLDVKVCLLCPGPIRTNFLNIANVKFKTKLMSKEYVAKYAIDNMFKGKKIIIPGIQNKCIRFLSKITPDKLIAKIIYNMQEEKVK